MSEENKQQAEKIYNVGSINTMYVENMIVQQRAAETQPSQLPAISSGKTYITDQKKSRYLLDDYSDEDEFEIYPDRLYVLSLYFITLKDESDHYALFDYVTYAPMVNAGKVNDDIWSVPYTITTVDLGGRKVRKVKEIRSVYDSALPGLQEKLSTLEENLFYNLGVFYKEVEKGREYIEYKRSTTEPDKMRCNYVREFFVHDIDSTGVLNLADPECLHQHRYAPLSLIDKLPVRNDLLRFMGKPVPHNVSDILLYEKRRLLKNAIKVGKSDLTYRIEGFIFIVTLMNGSKLIHYILYLNCSNADIERAEEKLKAGAWASLLGGDPREVKRNERRQALRENEGSQTFDVGYRIAGKFKRSYTQGATAGNNSEATSSRGYGKRRAHYHHFWVGPRDGKLADDIMAPKPGERGLILKWLEATEIHPELRDDLATDVPVGRQD